MLPYSHGHAAKQTFLLASEMPSRDRSALAGCGRLWTRQVLSTIPVCRMMYHVVYLEVYEPMPRMMVQLDDQLLAEVKRLTGARTKRAAIETALAELVRRRKAAELAKLAGKVPIRLTQRDLRAMREGR